MFYSHNRILLSNKKEQVIGTWINLQNRGESLTEEYALYNSTDVKA